MGNRFRQGAAAAAVMLLGLAPAIKAAGQGLQLSTLVCTEIGSQPSMQHGMAFVSDGRQVAVLDAVIQKARGHSIVGTVVENTSEHLRFRWRVANFPGNDNHGGSTAIDLNYSALYIKGERHLYLTLLYGGSDENPPYLGEYTCVPRQPG